VDERADVERAEGDAWERCREAHMGLVVRRMVREYGRRLVEQYVQQVVLHIRPRQRFRIVLPQRHVCVPVRMSDSVWYSE
jgi:hypothetical protein